MEEETNSQEERPRVASKGEGAVKKKAEELEERGK